MLASQLAINHMNLFKFLSAIILATQLIACGGGGSAVLGVLPGALNSSSPVTEPPIANAGITQNVSLGFVSGVASKLVTLDGLGSSGPNSNSGLSFAWTLTKPTDSTAVLSSATEPRPTFTADKVGTYTAQLIVKSGNLESKPSVVTIVASITNSVPIAIAGPDQNVVFGANTIVTLDGTYSSDADNDEIKYEWTLNRPPGSAAFISAQEKTSPRPTFIADVKGKYVAQLTVTDEKSKKTECGVDPLKPLVQPKCQTTVTADVTNFQPIARAGEDKNVSINTLVTLDGTNSTDDNFDPLTYKWNWMYWASTTPPTLSLDTSPKPTFTPSVAGLYVLTLVVTDDKKQTNSISNPDPIAITVSATNSAPVANAGVDRTVTSNATVTLSGSYTDANVTDTITYKWYLRSKPALSTATLTVPSATPDKPTFTPDVVGNYVFVLIVNDGKVDSEPAIVVINRSS
jgi:hypothetical protein